MQFCGRWLWVRGEVLGEILGVYVAVDGGGDVAEHPDDELDEVEKKLFDHQLINIHQLFNMSYLK